MSTTKKVRIVLHNLKEPEFSRAVRAILEVVPWSKEECDFSSSNHADRVDIVGANLPRLEMTKVKTKMANALARADIWVKEISEVEG